MVYLSGQVPKNTEQDVAGQTREILATIDELLALANTDKSRLLSAQLYLKNLSDFSTVNAIWVDWLKGVLLHRVPQFRPIWSIQIGSLKLP